LTVKSNGNRGAQQEALFQQKQESLFQQFQEKL